MVQTHVMAWLGVIWPHRRDEDWSASLWQTFFWHVCWCKDTSPRLVLANACKKCALDALGDDARHLYAHSGAKKAHDWAVEQLANLFRTTHRVQTLNRWLRAGVSDVEP